MKRRGLNQKESKEGLANQNARIACCECNFGAAAARPRLPAGINNLQGKKATAARQAQKRAGGGDKCNLQTMK